MAASAVRVETLKTSVLPAARATFEAYRQGLDTQIDAPEDVLDARKDLAPLQGPVS